MTTPAPSAPSAWSRSGRTRRPKNASHCIEGHELTEANTYLHPRKGQRRCRTCIREQQARRRSRQDVSSMPAFVFAIDAQLRIDRGDDTWMRRGNCAGTDQPDIFYVHPRERTLIAQAKVYCSSCPVRNECLTYALNNDERYGVWGGLTGPERHALKRA